MLLLRLVFVVGGVFFLVIVPCELVLCVIANLWIMFWIMDKSAEENKMD